MRGGVSVREFKGKENLMGEKWSKAWMMRRYLDPDLEHKETGHAMVR